MVADFLLYLSVSHRDDSSADNDNTNNIPTANNTWQKCEHKRHSVSISAPLAKPVLAWKIGKANRKPNAENDKITTKSHKRQDQ